MTVLPPLAADGAEETVGSITFRRHLATNAWIRMQPAIDFSGLTPGQIAALMDRLPSATTTNRGIMTAAQVVQLNALLAAMGNLYVPAPPPGALAAGIKNNLYSMTFVTTGGIAPYTYTHQAGVLPPGLTLDASSGALTGLPTTPGLYTFTIRATDVNGLYKDALYTLNIANETLSLTPTVLPDPEATIAYSQTLAVRGGSLPYGFAVTAGALPPGVTLNPTTGVISGTPTALGAFSFAITTTDNLGQTGTASYAVSVRAPTVTISPTGIPDGDTATPYSLNFVAMGGSGHTWAVSSGALPTGLALNPTTGVISGTPTVAGSYTFTIQATSVEAYVGTRAYANVDITAVAPTLTLAPATLARSVRNQAYTLGTVATSGGVGPYTYSISAGALPPGVTLNPTTGVISGTPTVAGSYTFTVRVQDSGAEFGTKVYTAQVLAPTAGTLSYSSLGALNIVIPAFENFITFEVVGPGGTGGRSATGGGVANAGQASTLIIPSDGTLSGGPGGPGRNGYSSFVPGGAAGVGSGPAGAALSSGIAGSASTYQGGAGGSANHSGSAGGQGGVAPTGAGANGNVGGGGGGQGGVGAPGYISGGSGGGGGGKASKVYPASTFKVDQVLSAFVGQSGAPFTGTGRGGQGTIKVTWS